MNSTGMMTMGGGGKAAEGTVRIYSQKLLEDLDDLQQESPMESEPVRTTQLSRAAKRMMEKREEKKMEFEQRAEEIHKRTQRMRATNLEKEDQKFQSTMRAVEDTLDFVNGDVADMLNAREDTVQRKRKELYDQWVHEVYEPIYGQIENHVRSMNYEEMSDRKRKLFDDFLKTTNSKMLFGDIILEDEYNPLDAHRHYGRYSTKNIKDPLRQAESDRKEEAKILQQKIAKDRTRKLQDPKTWPTFEDTTVGRLEHMRKKPIDRAYRPGTIGQDHYNVKKPQEVVVKEYFMGGKKSFSNMQKSNIPGLSTKWAS